MGRCAVGLLGLLLVVAGCGRGVPPAPPPAPAPVVSPAPPVVEAPPLAPAPPADPRPVLTSADQTYQMSRTEVRDGLLRLLEGTGEAGAKLAGLFARPAPFGGVNVLEVDLDGDGAREFVLGLAVRHDEYPSTIAGALFVVYQREGSWAVDVTGPVRDDVLLMAATVLGAVDMAGIGTPQIIWYRPEGINTGPQPFFVFATAWKPGAFTQLPGYASISRPRKDGLQLQVEGRELVLTGISRGAWFLRASGDPMRTDRYRYQDGGFRLVDRRFVAPAAYSYDFLWDGLVAEQVSRLQDAEAAYRAAADPGREAHSGKVPRYNSPPRELSPGDLQHFGNALRTLARFRLGALLLGQGRRAEALVALQPAGLPYDGLTDAMAKAADRTAGCRAAAAWAEANSGFLGVLNLGSGWEQWTPDVLCGHFPIEDRLP